uniref:BTB domain-containing protein n=1 Tax=Anopheles dirus TaxID=7168 RepID=A0A182NKC6_9DIPT
MPSDTPPPTAPVSHPSPASCHDPNEPAHPREPSGTGLSHQEADRSPGPSDREPPSVGPSAAAAHLLHAPHNTSSSSSSSSSSSTSSSASSSLSSLSLKRALAPEEPATKPSPPCSPLTMDHHLQAHKASSRATTGSPAGRNQQQQQQQQQSGASTTTGAGGGQQFCLRWNNYQTNLTSVFDQLLQSESFVDVTLACDGQSMKAHKMVLSACSPYFQTLFFDNPCQHPIVIMRDVSWAELKAIVEFMYKGEINVSQDQIGPLLKVAEMLKIRGLADVSGEGGETTAGGRSDRDGAGSRGPDDLERDDHKLLNPLAIVHSSLLANGANSSAPGSLVTGGSGGSLGGNSTATSGGAGAAVAAAAAAAAAKKQRSGRGDRDTTKDQHRLDARISDFARDLSRDAHISSRDISSVAAAAAAAAAAAGLAAGDWPLGPAGLEAAAAAAVQASTPKSARKRRWPSGERSSIGSPAESTPDQLDVPSPIPPTPTGMAQTSGGGVGGSGGGGGGGGASSNPLASFPLPPALDSAAMAMSSLSSSIANHPDDMEIKPGIAEMIREEERG